MKILADRAAADIPWTSDVTPWGSRITPETGLQPACIFTFDLHSFHIEIRSQILHQHYMQVHAHACTCMYCIQYTHTRTQHVGLYDRNLAFHVCVLIGRPRWPQTNQNKYIYIWGKVYCRHARDSMERVRNIFMTSSGLWRPGNICICFNFVSTYVYFAAK